MVSKEKEEMIKHKERGSSRQREISEQAERKERGLRKMTDTEIKPTYSESIFMLDSFSDITETMISRFIELKK